LTVSGGTTPVYPAATVLPYAYPEYPWGQDGASFILRFLTEDPRRGLTQLTVNNQDYLGDPRAVAYIHRWLEHPRLWDTPWRQDGNETEMEFQIAVLRPS